MNQIGHGKIFAATYTGSMYGQRDILTLWPYVIANANADHTVELNPSIISGSLGWAIEEVQAAIAKLCSPDANSRSNEHDGKRLLPRGGFMYLVVTHEKYGFIKNEDERKAYFAAKQRESRDKRKGNNGEVEPEKSEQEAADPNMIDSSRMAVVNPVRILDEPAAIAQAEFKGCDPQFAKQVYLDWKSRAGRDAGNVPVEWMDYISKRWEREKTQWMDGSHHFKNRTRGGGSTSGNGSGIPLGLQLRALDEQIGKSPANPTSTFFKPNCTELEKAALTQLRRKRSDITAQIANSGTTNNQ